MKNIITGILILAAIEINAQDSTSVLEVNGYVELYYQYDFNKPIDNNRPVFLFNHNRHNEFNLNLGLIKASLMSSWLRANIGIATGTYMNANYAAEHGVMKDIFEANAGIKLGRKNLWLDAGIIPSHIGFETAIGKECWNLSRSILADNSPYFQAGAKLSYATDDEKWLIATMALNGWQRISRVNGNSMMSWGTQIQYKPSRNILLNSSIFYGTDKPDSSRLNRFFHNFYTIISIKDNFGITAGFDYGIEEKFPNSNQKNTWYSPVLIFRYVINQKWTVAARAEYYNDKNSVIIATGTPNGFKTRGFSFNLDHNTGKNLMVRLEYRNLNSKDAIFIKGNNKVKNNSCISSSLSVSL